MGIYGVTCRDVLHSAITMPLPVPPVVSSRMQRLPDLEFPLMSSSRLCRGVQRECVELVGSPTASAHCIPLRGSQAQSRCSCFAPSQCLQSGKLLAAVRQSRCGSFVQQREADTFSQSKAQLLRGQLACSGLGGVEARGVMPAGSCTLELDEWRLVLLCSEVLVFDYYNNLPEVCWVLWPWQLLDWIRFFLDEVQMS